jgi:hypothetical protein
MMDEKELEQQLQRLRADWRVTGEPPLDSMWTRIEAEAFRTAPRRAPARWVRTLLPLAAMLMVGFGVGQLAPSLIRRASRAPSDQAAVANTQDDGTPARFAGQEEPFVGIATDYLERVTALVVTLAEESRRGQPLEHSTAQARDLLSTTRILMDSPQAGDRHLQDLLEDLELVLAQIVRLPSRPAPPDVQLIDQALDQRDVIPRLRVFLAENTSMQP